jgi:hypothetical protein
MAKRRAAGLNAGLRVSAADTKVPRLPYRPTA